AGSARLDLATSDIVTLLDTTVHLLPTGVSGPFPVKTQALILGRSSTMISGLFVFPGVVDSDSTDKIQIMAWTPFPPRMVAKGSCIAQLLSLPLGSERPPAKGPLRNKGGFGSTGDPQILWVQTISQKRPICQCVLMYGQQKTVLSGIIDAGADITVIS
ncbi:hypothetical protein N307_00689, partial [Dryobates pubescens]